jgi:competence protein ComEA
MSRILKSVFIVCLVVGLAAPVWGADAAKININTADAQQLTQLAKVGPAVAQRIVEFREANGPFKAPEDIMQVKGVGDKIFELNKERITVGGEARAKKTG